MSPSEWIDFGQPWSRLPDPPGGFDHAKWDEHYAQEQKVTFLGRKLAKPGVEVEVGSKRYLIGDINRNGGVCDDCMAFEPTAVVTRYRVLIERS